MIKEDIFTSKDMPNVKHLPIDVRIELMRGALTNENTVNPFLVLNIFNLLKGYITYDPNYFDQETSIANTPIEFVTFRNKLKKEIKVFATILAKWHLSMLRSMAITEALVHNAPKPVPPVIDAIYSISDFITLAQIISEADTFSTDDLFPVLGARQYVADLCQKYVFAGAMEQEVIKNIWPSQTTNQSFIKRWWTKFFPGS